MNSAATPSAPPPDPRRAYSKQFRRAAQLRFLAFFLAFFVYGLLRINQWSASFAQSATSNFYVQLVICWVPLWLLCAVAQIPPSLYSFYLDRKFQIASNNLFPFFGWILAGILSSFLFMLVNRSLPWLLSFFYPVLPLTNKSFQERLTQLAAKARLRVGTIYEWRIAESTRRANALVTGSGSARRILLTDTLISALSEDEVDAIVAHELA